jgi:hypothetical protein
MTTCSVSRAVLLPLVSVAVWIVLGGCSRSNKPQPTPTQQKSVAKLQTPSTPPIEAPAASEAVEPSPALAQDRSIAVPAVTPEEPVSSMPAVEPMPDLRAVKPERTGVSVDGPVSQPSVEPSQEPVPPARDSGLRPNPLRDGQIPSGVPQFVSSQEAQKESTAAQKSEVPETPKSETPETPKADVSEMPKAEVPVTADGPLHKGKHSGAPFDPIKENGTIFERWPKPQVALVVSGRQDGYLEPCGCAGLDRMKGGLSRRGTLFEQLRKDGWPLVGIDVGGQCKTFGRQAVLKFQATVDALKKMGYNAVTLGVNDLRLPAGEVLAVTAAAPGQQTPFVSANVALFGFAAEMTPKKLIVEAGGKKLGITGVLGKTFQKEINNPDIEMADPETALIALVPELKKQCDILVLLAHATLEESIELGKKFPQFDVIVTAGGPPEQPPTPKTIPGNKTLLIEVGEKVMNLVVLGFYDDPAQPVRYQRVPLDSRFPAAPEITLLMSNYQTQLRNEGLQGLGIRPVPHPRKELQGSFVGTEKCKDCHEKSYDVWKKSGHAKAWATLKNTTPPRDADPECVSCHVVGWHGQQFFPYESGFLSEKETPKLVNVGCESCHGPGEKHVQAEKGSDAAAQKKYQEAMVVTKEEAEKRQCYTCHDLDNSPDFEFQTYWPYVEHKEE